MTLQEILKAKGLSDDDVTSVIGEMKQNKIFTASEENLDIRYKDLHSKFEGKDKEHQQATELIAQLKKDNLGNDTLQGKITEYETEVTALKTELEQTKVESALKVALIEAKVVDVDYVTFKIKEKGEIKLGEDGKIQGISDTIASLKTQFPNQFATESRKKIEENKLPDGGSGDNQGITKEKFEKMGYQDRLQFYNQNPEAYNEFANKNN